MTADPPGTDDSAISAASADSSRLDALEADATGEHLAVYTAIAVELAARLDDPNTSPHPAPPDAGERGAARA